MSLNVDRSLALPESEYFAEPQAKSGIALHHTVCADAVTAIDWWRTDKTLEGNRRRVATAYVIDRDGTVFELFDPEHWAFHLGVPWAQRKRVAFEQRFIGIEIASEGGLREYDGRLYAYNEIAGAFEKPREEAFECPTDYRGYHWFDRYEPEQSTSLGRLVNDLCQRFAIPRVYPEKPFVYYGEALASFKGVIGHAMVRSDKSDPAPDPELWTALETAAGLRPVTVAAAAPLTVEEAEALYKRNVRRLNRMDVAAASLVKNLMMELERRDAYLEFDTPQSGSHTIDYQLLDQSDRAVLEEIAEALGFKEVTDTELEVADA
jgi:hypothetical protein